MRWLVIHPGPAFSVADVYNGWVDALRSLGEHVLEFNLDKRLQFFDAALLETGNADSEGHPEVRKALDHDEAILMAAEGVMSMCYRVWPDVVLGISAFFTHPVMLDIMRARKHKIVLLHTESPYQDEEQLGRAGHADINLLNDPVNIEKYRALGTVAEYMPHAYRPDTHYPAKAGTSKLYDLSFIGTGFKSRQKFFETMDLSGLDVALGGPWYDLAEDSPLRDHMLYDPEDCIDNNLTADIYRTSRCGINFYRRESEDAHEGEGWAMGPREVEMAACGLPFLRDSRPEGDNILPMLLKFDGPEDASVKLRWLLKHQDAAGKMAGQAREAVADRTFENNAKRLMRLVEQI